MMIVPGELLNRAKAEYVEMPGLALTISQASRLWNLDVGVCEALLSSLEREHFLARTRSAAYIRRDTGSASLRAKDRDEDAHWIADLDGKSIRAGARAWEVRSFVQRIDDYRWLPVALVGRPCYTALLKMARTAQLQDAIHALEWWLASPGRENGDVIEVTDRL